ncbi:DUF4271 domain-containing protein [Arcticibacter eurypsychrophilus]|uniref:DUF4271 domain-containing protein n=1 Tax=Arcticibacter eurypsychrophilus TaxID=1434752 RepID=UPI00084D2E19|nr:DUF4271 domain-containing protein [Arcticibacter eurypsychrophilus]
MISIRYLILLSVLFFVNSITLQAQVDSADLERYSLQDSSGLSDSVNSLNINSFRAPDPNRVNLFKDSLIAVHTVKNLDFVGWAKKFIKNEQQYNKGAQRKKGELWVIAFVFVALILFAILRNMFFNELSAIINAFFSNRVLGQINKEEKFFNSWPFVFLYLLFGFTIGMFLYQCGKYFQLSYSYSGFQWFLRLSMIVIGLFTLKIILLRLLGFLFDSVKLVKEYISILFLSYFSAALLFLPIVVAFSLTPTRFAPYYIYLSLALILFIAFFQFTRAISNILTSYKFPKLYLILYLCALEICPILVLIKALRF